MGLSVIPHDVFVAFGIDEALSQSQPHGSGHIHHTFCVKTLERNYIFQCINQKIFPDVDALMENLFNVTCYITNCSTFKNSTLRFFKTINGGSYYTDCQGEYWRVMEMIPYAVTYDKALSAEMAFEAGKILGKFHFLLRNFPSKELHIILPGFHQLEVRWHDFILAMKKAKPERLREAGNLIQSITSVSIDEIAFSNKIYHSATPRRVVHNDPKINNVLFDQHLKGICMIDLDTVMPGSYLHDFGDALRTTANPLEEDEPDISLIQFDSNLLKAYCEGYLPHLKNVLTNDEIDGLPHAPAHMTFIIGLRFLTDYLNEDVYFRIDHSKHNLQRAKAQFALYHDFVIREKEIKRIIHSLIN